MKRILLFGLMLFLMGAGCTTSKMQNEQTNKSLFRPINKADACLLSKKYFAFREKLTIVTVQEAYKCVTNEEYPQLLENKNLWAFYLQPTPAHPRYQEFAKTKDPLFSSFVPHYVVSKKSRVLVDTQKNNEFFIEENSTFRVISSEERKQVAEIEKN